MPKYTPKHRNIPLLEFTDAGRIKQYVAKQLQSLGLKYCPTCQTIKSFADFYSDIKKGDGLYGRCKLCHNQVTYKWARNNPEKVNALTKKSYERNKQNWISTRTRYKKENRAALREYRKQQYRENQEKERKQNRIWSRSNPERIKALAHNRRTKLLNAEGSHTADDLKLLWEQQDGRCAYCDCELTPEYRHLDHVMPLSRGGSNWPSNLAWACPPCNLSKNNRLLEEWLND